MDCSIKFHTAGSESNTYQLLPKLQLYLTSMKQKNLIAILHFQERRQVLYFVILFVRTKYNFCVVISASNLCSHFAALSNTGFECCPFDSQYILATLSYFFACHVGEKVPHSDGASPYSRSLSFRVSTSFPQGFTWQAETIQK